MTGNQTLKCIYVLKYYASTNQIKMSVVKG